MNENLGTWIGLAVIAAYFVFRSITNRKAPVSLVREKIAAGARVVDVRSRGEFSGGAYPKARNIPVDELPSRLSELRRDEPIVLYCASGARSANAARILRKAGYTDVHSAGGLFDMPR